LIFVRFTPESGPFSEQALKSANDPNRTLGTFRVHSGFPIASPLASSSIVETISLWGGAWETDPSNVSWWQFSTPGWPATELNFQNLGQGIAARRLFRHPEQTGLKRLAEFDPTIKEETSAVKRFL